MNKYFNCCLYCQAWQPTHRNLCGSCRNTLPYLKGHRCEVCLSLLSSTAQIRCGACLSQTKAFDHLVAPFDLEGLVHQSILQFKFREALIHGHLLSQLLLEYIQAKHVTLPNLILPVPLHRKRQFWRGFNQSYEIAKHLSKHLAVPVSSNVLIKIKNTQAQNQSSRMQRVENLKRAFILRNQVLPRHVALLDDVYTTGSTALECAKILKKGGVQQVDVWVVAKTK